MPIYKYRAMTEKGKRFEGEFSANSKNEVLAMIRENNYYPLMVEEKIQSAQINLGDYFVTVKAKDLAVFCRQLSTLIDAGSDLLNSLYLLSKQAENKKVRDSLEEIHDEVQKGITLSQAMAKYENVYPKLLINMIQSGEETGNLGNVVERMADQYEKEHKMNSKIQGALIYPAILMFASVGVIIFLLTFVMPTFVAMFQGSGVALPALTQFVMDISSGIREYWYLIFIVTVLSIIGIKILPKGYAVGKIIDNIKINIPVIKHTSRKIISYRFARALSTALSSGVSMLSAIELAKKVVNNRVVEAKLVKAKEKIVKGIPLSETLKDIIEFPVMLIGMIKIGEESGALDSILEKTAKFYEQEVEEALDKTTRLVEPLMILLMGLIVGFIVLAMLLPIFDMIKAVDV